MSFHLSSWSIKNPIPTIVIFAVLAVLGLSSFTGLGIDTYPNIDIPAISVTVVQQGASPTELESQVTRKVEDAVAGLDNIDQIISSVRDEVSITTIGFEIGTDSDQAVNDVRSAIYQIRQDLPENINEPVVEQEEFYRESVITYAVMSPNRSVEELSYLVDRTINRNLLKIPGVAEVTRLGGVDREIRVNLSSERLKAHNITATEVNDQIRNFNVNLPSGRLETGGNEQNVRTLGTAKNISILKDYAINLSNGDTVALSNLGSVEDKFADVRSSAHLNNQSVVAFSVQRSTGSTLVTVEKDVRQGVAELEKTLPDDINLEIVFTRANAIRASYQGTVNSLIIGSFLTVAVVGLFLGDWRATLVTIIALPLSIIPTFWVMNSLGYTLNTMTLNALALAVGNLVDDAICAIENIDQHLNLGKKPFQAAIDAAQEIGLAIVATTATIVAVFIPVAFMGGVPGQFFQPFGLTFAVSTSFSTLVACTVTPMLSAYWLKSKATNRNKNSLLLQSLPGNKTSQPSRLAPANNSLFNPSLPETKSRRFQPYRQLLQLSLSNRITTVIVAIAIFLSSLLLSQYIPQGLSGGGDKALSILAVELPPGSELAETESVLSQINKLVQGHLEVKKVLTVAGEDGKVNVGSVYISLVPKQERTISQQNFEQELRNDIKTIPGARISFRSQGVGVGNKDLSIVLRGQDTEILEEVARNLEEQMETIPGLVEVSSSASLVKPEITIVPDPFRAKDLGVSVQAIANTTSLALLGEIESNLAKFNLADRQIPIRVQLDPKERKNIDTIRNLLVPSDRGTLVPLRSVADIRLASGPVEINRLNRSRQVMVEANLQDIALGEALKQVRALPAMNPLPPGITEEPVPGGDAEIMQDVFNRFSRALAFGILCIYAILILLYNNFLYPLAILVALPMSVGGAFLALLITQKELGLFALIGMVLLMGLVTKNAILLVDFSLDGIRQGKPLIKAVVEAGVSRLRPILMTSVSTIAGMIPIALEFGADGEVRSPMAIAVIGGFTTSTLLTLVVVPVLFVFVSQWYRQFTKIFGLSQKYSTKS